MSLTIWKIKDLELDLNVMDYEQNEKMTDALKLMKEEEKAIPKDGTSFAFLKAYCDLYYNLFKRIFSEEVANKLAKRSDASDWERVYIDFINFISAQNEDSKVRRAAIIAKGKGNREQRRNAQKKHAQHYN